MKPFVRIACVICAAAFLSACGMQKPQSLNHQVIDVPDGKGTKTIALDKVVVKIPRGTEIGKIKEGFACITYGKLVRTSGGKRFATDEDFTSVFNDELKGANYNVLGDTSNLFEDKTGNAEIRIGCLVTSITKDICYPAAAFGNYLDGSSVASIEVEWQVYSALDRKMLYKKKVSGNAEYKFTNDDTMEVEVLAFADTVRGLLADKEFHNIVLEKAPVGSMGGLSDAGPQGVSPKLSVAGGRDASASKGSKPNGLAEAKNHVVVVRMPGGHGSGFLVGNEGYILTNDHVVTGLTKVRIFYQDGSTADGRVVKSDPKQDVGLIKVESPPVGGLSCRLEELQTGTEVYAIGAPLDEGYQGSMSKGIVSGYRTNQKGHWLQSDVSVNHGNSGGPLVDAQGRVVGMCSWGAPNEAGTMAGVNFFVPISDALRVMDISGK